MALLLRPRVGAVASRRRAALPWLASVCLAGSAAALVIAFAVTDRVPQHDNAELRPVLRPIPGTSNVRQAGAPNSADARFAPVDSTAVPDGDVVAERMADAARTIVALDPDDASYLRQDGEDSHIGEPLDPDDESAMAASGDVSHIGDYLDQLDE